MRWQQIGAGMLDVCEGLVYWTTAAKTWLFISFPALATPITCMLLPLAVHCLDATQLGARSVYGIQGWCRHSHSHVPLTPPLPFHFRTRCVAVVPLLPSSTQDSTTAPTTQLRVAARLLASLSASLTRHSHARVLRLRGTHSLVSLASLISIHRFTLSLPASLRASVTPLSSCPCCC